MSGLGWSQHTSRGGTGEGLFQVRVLVHDGVSAVHPAVSAMNRPDRAAGPASFASAVRRSPRRTIGVDYLVAILHDKGLANYKGYHIQSADTSTGQDIAVITKLTPDTISGQKIRNVYSAGCGIRLPHGQA